MSIVTTNNLHAYQHLLPKTDNRGETSWTPSSSETCIDTEDKFCTHESLDILERALPFGSAAVAGLATGLAASCLGTTGSLVGGAVGAGLGYIAGKAYQIPDRLYHFTSQENAEKIKAGGTLQKRPGNHGEGVYATRFESPLIATLQRAASTDMQFRIPTKGLKVKRTIVPGTFRITEDVKVDATSLQSKSPDPVTQYLQEINFRELLNPNG